MIASHVNCSCGRAVTLVNEPCYRGWNWTAYCGDCYDPTPDAGLREHVSGRGATAYEALVDFREDHDLAHDV